MLTEFSLLETRQLSDFIENTLVARNLRGMKTAQAALQPGYFFRAAKTIQSLIGSKNRTVLIGTGFPVVQPNNTYTFETDGPVGAIALYDALEALDLNPIMVTSGKLARAFQGHYRVQEISEGLANVARHEAQALLKSTNPALVMSIEMPGLNAKDQYSNMRGENISAMCPCFDAVVQQAYCPTIAIGDGGNEIGMGNISYQLKSLPITPSESFCDELLVADVSNWATYGLLCWLSVWNNTDLLAAVAPLKILKFLSDHGSVDGVTRKNTLSEDGMSVDEGESVIHQFRTKINL